MIHVLKPTRPFISFNFGMKSNEIEFVFCTVYVWTCYVSLRISYSKIDKTSVKKIQQQKIEDKNDHSISMYQLL